MQFNGIPYLAFGPDGEYKRDALVIGELPHEMRETASKQAAQCIAGVLGVPAPLTILAGVPVYRSFEMRPADAKRHQHANLLLTLATDVPLSHCG
jgi:hypothetical protein